MESTNEQKVLLGKINELKEKENLTTGDRISLSKLQREFDSMTSTRKPGGVFLGEIEEELMYINIRDIEFPEYNDRSGILQEGIVSLAKNIKEVGLLQPIVVEDIGKGKYRKIIGKRRILAYEYLEKTKIKAIVKKEKSNDFDHLLKVMNENIQREDVSIYDKVRATVKLVTLKKAWTTEEVLKRISRADNLMKGNIKSATKKDAIEAKELQEIIKLGGAFKTLSNLKKHSVVLHMSDKLIDALNENKISFTIANMLNTVKEKQGEKIFEKIFNEVISQQLSIQEIEMRIKENIPQLQKKNEPFEKVVLSIKKVYKRIPKEKISDFEEEIEKLILKYKN